MEKQLKVLKQAGLNDKKGIASLQNKRSEENKKNFSHIIYFPNRAFFNTCVVLNADQFNIILDCDLPYIHLVP